ncbi:MAG: hypothetical protein KJ667_02595, partial [Alphaproteobacteria bacterium]|nr:hypothetical protein [Alphaproteobacteria bacterium]
MATNTATPGFLTALSGKAFTAATVAALTLPLIALGHSAAAAPQDAHDNAAVLSHTFNRPAYEQTVAQPAPPLLNTLYNVGIKTALIAGGVVAGIGGLAVVESVAHKESRNNGNAMML